MTRPNACRNQRQGERCPFLLFGADGTGLAPDGVVVVEFDPGAVVDDVVVVNERVTGIALVVERCHELMRDCEDLEAIIRIYMNSVKARSKTVCLLSVWRGSERSSLPLKGTNYYDLAALHKHLT